MQPGVDPPLTAVQRALADHRTVVQVADQVAVGPLGHPRRREDHHHRVLAHEQRLDPVVGHRTHREGQVAVVGQHPVDQVADLLLEQPDVQPRRLLPQPTEQRGQQLHRDRLERPDDQPATGAGLQVRQLLLRHREPVQHRRGVTQQQATRRGQRRRTGTAWPVEHRGADGLLQARDLLADGRLAHAEDSAGTTERAFLGDGGQRDEVPDLDVRGGSHEH